MGNPTEKMIQKLKEMLEVENAKKTYYDEDEYHKQGRVAMLEDLILGFEMQEGIRMEAEELAAQRAEKAKKRKEQRRQKMVPVAAPEQV